MTWWFFIIKQKWGKDRVIRIKTFGYFRAGGAFGAISKISGKDWKEVSKIRKNIDYHDSLENQITNNSKLKKLYNKSNNWTIKRKYLT